MMQNMMTIPVVILRRRQVETRTGMKRSTIYDHIKSGDFPSPIRLSAKSVGWIESEIDAWLFEKVCKTRGGQNVR